MDSDSYHLTHSPSLSPEPEWPQTSPVACSSPVAPSSPVTSSSPAVSPSSPTLKRKRGTSSASSSTRASKISRLGTSTLSEIDWVSDNEDGEMDSNSDIEVSDSDYEGIMN